MMVVEIIVKLTLTVKGGVGIIILKILVGRKTSSIGETFGEIFRSPLQIGYMPRPCPNMARKLGIFISSPKVVTIILNRKVFVS